MTTSLGPADPAGTVSLIEVPAVTVSKETAAPPTVTEVTLCKLVPNITVVVSELVTHDR